MIATLKENWLQIFLAFLLSLYYVMPKFMAVGIEITFLVFLFFLFHKFKILKGRIMPISWYIIFSAVILLTNLDDPFNPHITTCINNIIFISLSYYVIREKQDIETFIRSFAAFGLLFSLLLIPAIIMSFISNGVRLGLANEDDAGSAFLSDPIRLGYLLVIVNVCQFYSMNVSESKKIKLFYLLAFLFSFFCIMLTGTRKAIIASFITIGCFYYYGYRKKKKKLFKYLLYGIAFVLIIYIVTQNNEVLYNAIGRRFEGLLGFMNSDYGDADKSTSIRSDLMKRGWEIFWMSPLVGVGFKKTEILLDEISHPHNNYLSCLDFGGIFTLVAYYWFYFKIIINYNRLKHKDNLDFFLFGLMLAFIFTDYTATTYNIIFFPTFITIIYLNSLLSKKLYFHKSH